MRKLLPIVLAVPLLGQEFHVNLRSRVEAYKGSGEWQEVQIGQNLEPKKTAIVICDVWDKHWCTGATERVAKLAPAIDRLIEVARRRGVLIIHAPSDTMEFHKNGREGT